MKKILIFIVFVIVFAYIYTLVKPVLPSLDYSKITALFNYFAEIGG